MDQKQLKHITGKHYMELNEQIRRVAENFDVESIHQFRVEYKKLRAFFRLISRERATGKEMGVTKKLKKAYHISGYIRDLQLQQQRIQSAAKQESKGLRDYIRLLKKKNDKLKAELAEIIRKKPVAECKKKTDAVVPDEFKLSGTRSFIRKNWEAINDIIASGDLSDENIHTIRKRLKDLFYNLKIYNANNNFILLQGSWKGKNESFFYRFMDELGSFQDNCRAITLLKTSWLKGLKAETREQLKRIKKRWVKNKLMMKGKIVRKMKQISLSGELPGSSLKEIKSP